MTYVTHLITMLVFWRVSITLHMRKQPKLINHYDMTLLPRLRAANTIDIVMIHPQNFPKRSPSFPKNVLTT